VRRVCRSAVTLLLPLLCGCGGGWQSAMQPQGPQAARVHALFWLFTIVCAVVWIAVMAVLIAAMMRRRSPSAPPDDPGERRPAIAVGSAVAATVLAITGLTLASYLATRGLAGDGEAALTLRVRGHQWWWDITYDNPAADQVFKTANEIHIPVGRPVRIELAAADVIHSFWVPNLAGKQDQIPGRDNSLALTATKPGIYRGQCAEFCGLQHAHMALIVIAEPPDVFEAWRQAQLAAGAPPSGEEQQMGQRVLTGKACAACHTVRGTAATGTLGPDLTHVGGRVYIAAGILPVTRGSLAAWVADPQTIKPGNSMPLVTLTADELRAVSAYLASLK
jgi:cytochrome c oxidase subunit II